MGVGVCYLTPGGVIQPHFHSFEESFYILEGHATLKIGEKSHTLEPGHYGLIPTESITPGVIPGPTPAILPRSGSRCRRPSRAFPNMAGIPSSSMGTRLLRMKATPTEDTSTNPNCLAPASRPEEGFNPTTGVAIKMFVDRSFGAIHQSLFLIQYMPGAKIDPHDHAFEESYLIVSGRVRATADGKTYDLGPGDVIWTGVGCIHSFENVGSEPVRWIERKRRCLLRKKHFALSATGQGSIDKY